MGSTFPDSLRLMPERRRQLNWVERRQEASPSPGRGWYFVNVAMRVDRVLLPASGGRISSAPGQTICLLETVGAKSGQTRQAPLLYIPHGERMILIGSKAGAPRHGWIHNLRANPRVRILAPRRTGDYNAREAEGEERERLWAKAVDYYAGYATYAERAGERRIPVVVLERAAWRPRAPRIGPIRRLLRRDTAGSLISRCVSASPASRRSSCSSAIGFHSSSTTRAGSPSTSSRSRCSDQSSSRVRRASSGSVVTTFISVSLKSECSLRLAEPTVSQRSSTMATLACT